MSQKTPIEWSEYSWNPIRGCTRCSPGCKHCYAERIAARFSETTFAGYAIMTPSGPRWTGKVGLIDEKLLEPLHWRKPRRAFISMSDPFHEDLPLESIARVFAVMSLALHIRFQLLTKRSARLREITRDPAFWRLVNIYRQALLKSEQPGVMAYPLDFPLPNVDLGVSVENRETAAARIPDLVGSLARRRFVSYEPALEGVPFTTYFWSEPRIDQVIIGGESGPEARPFRLEWARRLVAAGRRANVAVFVKQLGARPIGETEADLVAITNLNGKGSNFEAFPPDLKVRETI